MMCYLKDLFETKKIRSFKNEQKNKKKAYNINISNSNKACFILIRFLLIIISFFLSLSKEATQIMTNSNKSYIILKINKIGYSDIYYKNNHCGNNRDNELPFPIPNEIYINEVNQNVIKTNYCFNMTNNTVKLV